MEEIGKYVMALYRAESRYQLLVSDDLLHWELMQEIPLHGDAECPDLFALTCGDKKRWVLMGANDVYVVGYFEKDRFVIENAEKKLTYLKMSYAAQSFSDVPDGRVIRIAWHNLRAPADNFASQMSIPAELTLAEAQEQYYLCSAPVRELEQLYRDGKSLRKVSLSERVKVDTGAHALDLSLSMPYVQGETLRLSVLGTDIGRRCLLGDRAEVRVIADRCSVEIFADAGKFFGAAVAYADCNLPFFAVDKNESLTLDTLTWHTLANIHTEEN